MRRAIFNYGRDTRVWLSLILLLAFALRSMGINFGLPLQLHPDEPSQVMTARQMLDGDLNPHFFRYSSLFIDQLFVLDGALEIFSSYAGMSLAPSIYFLLGRVLSMLYGILTVWAVFLLGKNAVNERTGLVGAFLIAIAPEHVRESHYATVDVAMVFWSILALALAVRALQKNSKLFFASAICAGLALGTKYSAGFILLPLVSLLMWKIAREYSSNWSKLNARSFAFALAGLGALLFLAYLLVPIPAMLEYFRQLTTDGEIRPEYMRLFSTVHTLGGGIGLAIILLGLGSYWNRRLSRVAAVLFHPRVSLFLLLSAGTFLVTSPFVILDFPNAVRDILYEYRHALIGGAALYKPSDPLYGMLLSSDVFPQPTFYFDVWMNQNGWILTLAVLVGAIVLVRQNLPVFVLISFIVALMVFTLTRSANKAERYALLLTPLFSFYAGVGIGIAMEARNIFRTAVAVTGLLAVVFTPIQSTATILYREFILPDTRVLALRWVEQNAASGTLIVRETNTPDIEDASAQFRVIAVNSAFDRKSIEDWEREGARYIMVGTIRDWYRTHSDIYPAIAHNYALLEARANLIQVFTANATSAGPPIWIYQLP